ncbi:MAG TPA: hypothetical protein VFL88_12290 [Gemmatimonadales bacterium]|nr:hypothetical protein [Gemmatimonadales bacterium]
MFNLRRPSVLSALSALSALLALSACGSTNPSDGITVATDQTSYTTTDPVVVTITNTTNSDVAYSNCPERWDHKVGDSYTRVEELQECLVGSTPLPAGESATFSYTFPGGQPAGTWRIPIPITSPDGDKVGEARTGDFEEMD